MKCIKCKRKIPDASLYCMFCGKKQITISGQISEFSVPAPRLLPSGSWTIQLRIGGRSVSVTRPTEAECISDARRIKAEHLASKRDQMYKSTLGAVIDAYTSRRENILSPSTLRGYKIIRNNRFQRYMDKDVELIDWQAAINEEAALCSPKTLKNAWGFICSTLKAHGVPRPAVRLPQIVPKDHLYLTPDQIRIFVSGVKGDVCEIPALLALHSLRLSELRALSWDNVDLQAKTITVAGAVVPGPDNNYVYKDTNKNTSSRRTIPIMIDRLYDCLSAADVRSGQVVHVSPAGLLKQINRVCNNNGLPEVGVHGLRHSFASLAYHLGMPERVAMAIGGWSDRETMHKIYIHLSQADVESGANTMSGFYSANGNANGNL